MTPKFPFLRVIALTSLAVLALAAGNAHAGGQTSATITLLDALPLPVFYGMAFALGVLTLASILKHRQL